MEENKEQPALLALLTEKYALLRKQSERMWGQEPLPKLSATEWYLLSRVHTDRGPVSDIARRVGITRQAAHKYIRGLEAKGLLHVAGIQGNRRDRQIHLTPLGEQCLDRWNRIQVHLEEQIARRIGPVNLTLLKDLCRADWPQ